MQLDKTRIVIRPRSTSELLDLSLKICAIYFKPLLVLTALIAVPMMIVNELLIGYMVAEEISSYTIPSYVAVMALLVILEGPFATMATTVFLGRMMFLQKTEVSFVLKQIRQFLHRIFWSQLCLRGVILGIVIVWNAREDDELLGLLWFMTIVVIIIRMARPYINEIILLEQNPFRKKSKGVITVRRRSSALHSQSSGDLIARWLMTAPAVIFMTVSLVLSLWFVQGVITNVWNWNWLVVRVYIPLAMWLAVIYTTVLRFVSYLDLRIRREGWEVELKVQAAAEELRERFA